MTKKFICAICVLVTALMFVGCSNSKTEDTSIQDIKTKGEFVLGLDDSFPPMGFRDKQGEIVGYDIDLAKEVANRIGVKLIIKPIEWDSNILSLNNGDIDVLWNGLSVTPQREKQVLFSDEYAENKQVIITRSESNIDKKSDLKDKVVAVQMGSTGSDALQQDKKTSEGLKEIRKFSNFTEALLDLKTGRVDAVVIDEVVGRYYISKDKDTYKIASEDFGSEAYAVGFRKEDISFRDAVNKALEDMKQDGSFEEIRGKWFGN